MLARQPDPPSLRWFVCPPLGTQAASNARTYAAPAARERQLGLLGLPLKMVQRFLAPQTQHASASAVAW